MNINEKNPWKKDTFEMEGNFKLAIYANEYLENEDEEVLEKFKKVLENSSSLSIAVVYNYINEQLQKEDLEKYKTLINLMRPKLDEGKPTYGVYNPEIGDFEYKDEINKKKM